MNCSCRTTCTGLSVVASIIIGIITAILVYTATVTITAAFSWVLLGVAVVALGVILLAVSDRSNSGDCACGVLAALLTGILGTVLTSIILLAITFGAGSIIGAIISGAALLFFSLIITSTACLIKCIANCDEE